MCGAIIRKNTCIRVRDSCKYPPFQKELYNSIQKQAAMHIENVSKRKEITKLGKITLNTNKCDLVQKTEEINPMSFT